MQLYNLRLTTSALRFVALTVLVVIVFMLATPLIQVSASSSFEDKCEKTCSHERSNEEGRCNDQCATPQCPAFLCILVSMPTPVIITVNDTLDDVLVQSNISNIGSPVISIFRPPKPQIV